MNAWNNSTWTDAGQIVSLIDPAALPEEASGKALPEFYAQLVESGKLTDAASFIAHALSRYDCIVWVTRALLEAGAVERTNPLMVAALRWVDNPDDETIRRAAGEMADAELRSSPAKMLAHAVFFSGGSLTAPDMPAVQPAPDICAKMAGSAVIAGMYATPDPDAAMRGALATGEAIAAGGA